MSIPRVPATLLFLLLSIADARSAEFTPASAHQLVHLAQAYEPRIAPDGSQVAFVLADSIDPTLRQIVLAPTSGGVRPHPLTAGGRSADRPRWTPDGRHLLFLSALKDTAARQVQIIAVAERESRPLTGEARGVVDMAVAPDGEQLVYLVPGSRSTGGDPIDAAARPAGSRLRLRRIDDPTTTTISPDTANVWKFAWSPDSKRLAVLFTRPGPFGEWRRGRLAVLDLIDNRWSPVPGRWDPTNNLAWNPGSDSLAVYALPASDYSYPILHVVPVTDGKAGIPIRLTPPEQTETFSQVAWTEGGGLVVMALAGVRSFLARVDPRTRRVTRLAECWTELDVDFSMNGAGTLTWLSGGLDGPSDVYSLLPGEREPRRLSILNPQLAERMWAPPIVTTWTSFDGRKIEGILFEPPAATPRPCPMVVMPHGGPSWQWALGFYADCHNPARYLAERGYAVFLPNPRGSTGYGEEFNALNRRDLGGGDWRDIDAGVDSLVAAGLADPSRLAIDGFSYGGFLAAWSVARSDRYRCAVVGAGPMNFLSGYVEDDLSPYWQEEYLGGPPWGDARRYLDRSPITFVAGVREPVLIVHGQDDIRVPLAQSRELFAALTDQGTPVEFRIYPREPHGFNERRHQVDYMERQWQWFERHLKGNSTHARP
ncbi:MAG: S9 family peptidase [Candidatus Eisenbacteria bacterium]|nr:S9 family peptidase [Candidatus Eisenbacteria bacterium]